MESNGADDARASLDAVAATRAGVAGRIAAPWWYHLVLGLLVAQHVLAQGLENANWTLPSMGLLLAGCLVLTLAYRRLAGLSTAKAQGTRSRNVLTLLGLVALACVASASLTGSAAVSWVAAGVVLLATIVLGRLFEAALRREIAADPDHSF
ncbi:hypothetical protein GCM10012287_17590 [Streptomyces daqingensis]|uniref:Transmembrane protein n=1 Tax=Streptomyces daqingensis TaxID=1472640 RepID=A0ABQ2M467_9ACTN|nr:hypothetical protein [Streptomyces daqingensis]GGO46674.1 hypothetical protein GCM10012287_17590 [Streptomyces daqingensis]